MNKILYPPLIMLGILLPIIVYTLYEHTTEGFVGLGLCGSFAIFVLWKSRNRQFPNDVFEGKRIACLREVN